MKHNGLSPAQEGRLAKLTEECGEVSQMVGKTLVHGWNNFHPRKPEEGTNRERLEKEIGGLLAVVTIMATAGDIDMSRITDARRAKQIDIWKYLHEQEDHGTNTGEGSGDSEDRRRGCC